MGMLLIPCIVSAQDQRDDGPTPIPLEADRRQIVPFLQGTYVFITVPREHIRFEADIQPNFVISQNFSDKLVTDESLNGRPRFAYSVVGTPRVRLRELDSFSDPVRTPSYMPKGSFTGILFRGERTDEGTPGSRVGIWAGQFTLGHHSNGQDGCLFTTDKSPDATHDDCTGTPDLTKINTHDGSFSTNYVRFGMRYRREWLKDVSSQEQKTHGIEEHLGTHEISVGVDYDRHFHTDPRVAPFYGQNRGELSFAFATHLRALCRSRATASASVFYVGEQPPDVPPLAFQGEGSCTFTDQGGWGLFVRYYDGQDYYNLGFATRIKRTMVGAHYDQDGFLRLVSRAAKDAAAAARQRRNAR